MHEIEIKLAYENKEDLISKLKELGASPKKNEEIIDTYFSKDSKTLKDAKEFIRIREKGGKAELTFKGEIESEGDIWKRVELNSDVSNPEAIEQMFSAMKFNKIRKNRTLREYWQAGNIEAVIVQIVEPVEIDFAEIEGPSEEAVDDFVKNLGDCVSPIRQDHFKELDKH